MATLGRAQSLASYSLFDDPTAFAQGSFGISLFSPSFSTLDCPQFGAQTSCQSATFDEFGFLRIRPIPRSPLRRVQAFVKWHYVGLDSTGVGREIGLMITLPQEFTFGVSQHRFYAFGPRRSWISPDGPGGGLWAGVFLEKDFLQNSRSHFRDGFAGITVFPPHNEFDPKACNPSVSPGTADPCTGFARYSVRGGARFYPLKHRPSIFLQAEGFGLFGSTLPQKSYTWSASPIGAGGRTGIGYTRGEFSINLCRDFYEPVGKYASDRLIGLYSAAGPFGGNITELSITWRWALTERRRRF